MPESVEIPNGGVGGGGCALLLFAIFSFWLQGQKKSFQNAPQYRRLSQQDERFRLNQIPKCFAIQKAPRLKLKPKANCDCDFALIRKQSEALRALISQRIFISCSLAGAR
jgi:hypothetical protein